MKKICFQLNPFSHVQERGDPCTNQVQICLKTEIKSRLGKRANQDFLERQKEQILAEVRSEIQKYPGITWSY